MRRAVLPALAALLLAAAAPPGRAEVWPYGARECNQLWFMRNLIMDRAGYCFGSALGQSLFDNGDCTGKTVTLSAAQTAQAEQIRALEQEIGCSVNTAATRLDVDWMAQLRSLRDMPLPDNGAAACTWAGPEAVLRAGIGGDAPPLRALRAGDRIDLGWIGEGDWTVIAVSSGGPGGPARLGWVDLRALDLEANCTDWVG